MEAPKTSPSSTLASRQGLRRLLSTTLYSTDKVMLSFPFILYEQLSILVSSVICKKVCHTAWVSEGPEIKPNRYLVVKRGFTADMDTAAVTAALVTKAQSFLYAHDLFKNTKSLFNQHSSRDESTFLCPKPEIIWIVIYYRKSLYSRSGITSSVASLERDISGKHKTG